MNSKFLSFLKNWRNQGPVVKWIIDHTRPFLPSLFLLLLLSVAGSVVNVALTLINRLIVDAATSGREFFNNIWLYVGILLFSLVVSVVNSILTAVINERFAFGIRLRVYDSVMNSCWSNISSYHSGDVLTRLSSDIDTVAHGIAELIPSIFSLTISFLIAFATLAYFDPGIALFALILGPATALVGIFSGRLIKPLQVKIQQSESAYKSFLQESVANLPVFKAFGSQKAAGEQLAELRRQRLYWVMRRQKVSSISNALFSMAFQAGYMGAFVYCAIRLSSGNISFGTMTAFLALLTQIQGPVVGLSMTVPRIVSVFASGERVLEIEQLPTEDMSVPKLAAGAIGVSVKDLCFAYGADTILENAGIDIAPGEFVALMGSSGIGKTTLIRLLLAYLSPDRGEVRLVDREGGSAPVNAGARAYMSYVPQGNTLLSGTILHNIRMGNETVTDEEIWEILSVVAVDEFVRSTPNQLLTRIGEHGLGLSEGQAQRLAIARALVKKSPLLILDEATSALDEPTEIAILEHLRRTQTDATCLLISHRRSVLKFCDRCIRISDKGLLTDESLMS